ncbi:glycerol-3-phosphate phosphatase isoform X2 [Folsomia candida]|uniref:Phosphoglycolate phosphatase n=1 Tax=Folsomia candida TaxID=158441 RepID=A0A226E7R0_FOLCA|nr:glycerol-3-phosphate phosphatase isoform X2 [Folsomia candida]OXA52911.1 Phosphoglycolate phosphatase [Folsomia candida]
MSVANKMKPTLESLETIRRGAGIPMQEVIGLFPFFMQNLDAVMFDCDGVLWMGNNPISGAQDLVKKLRTIGKKVFFLTNNSTKTREEFLEKFNSLGFEATLDEIVGTSYLTALYLKEQNFKGKVYVIGTTGITRELENVGIESLPIGPDPMPADMHTWVSSLIPIPYLDPEVKAVVVGFDHHLSFTKMIKAASYLRNPNCLFVATNTDERFPSGPEIVMPGTGSIVNAVKTAAEREPYVMGKPSPMPFEFVKRTHDLDPKKVLMIGDRSNTDILFGKDCGLWTLLVFSGVTTYREIETWKVSGNAYEKKLIPDFCLNGVENLLALINKHGEVVHNANDN